MCVIAIAVLATQARVQLEKISKKISAQKSLRVDLSNINGQTRWELNVLEKSNNAPF